MKLGGEMAGQKPISRLSRGRLCMKQPLVGAKARLWTVVWCGSILRHALLLHLALPTLAYPETSKYRHPLVM